MIKHKPSAQRKDNLRKDRPRRRSAKMICPKYHGFCDDFGAVSCCGDCSKCKDSRAAKTMTIGEWEDSYLEYAKATKSILFSSAMMNVNALHRVMCVMGLTRNNVMGVFTRSLYSEFFSRCDGLQPISRKCYIESIRRMCSEGYVEWANEHGLKYIIPPSPRNIKAEYEKYVPISSASMDSLRFKQCEYRESSDPRKWLMLTLALDHGMSKTDILRAKWSSLISYDNETPVISYYRHKTGKRAMWKISTQNLYQFKKAEETMKAMTKRGMSPDSTDSVLRICDRATCKERVTSHLWDDLCRELRDLIPEWKDDSKAAHNLRKEFANSILKEYQNWDLLEMATGDTVKVLKKSYVGAFKVDWGMLK